MKTQATGTQQSSQGYFSKLSDRQKAITALVAIALVAFVPFVLSATSLSGGAVHMPQAFAQGLAGTSGTLFFSGLTLSYLLMDKINYNLTKIK